MGLKKEIVLMPDITLNGEGAVAESSALGSVCDF